MSTEAKLFLVKFMMDDFADGQGKTWNSVPITVLAAEEGRKSLVPYEVGIKDYNSKQDFLKELSLNCLFSTDEAQQLADYIKENDNLEAEIDEVDLPIDYIWPWFTDMDAAYQGFMGVSEPMCSYMGSRLAAYFDVRNSEAWKKENP